MSGVWRVGDHYGIHVYEADRPVATFHDPADAADAVAARNGKRSEVNLMLDVIDTIPLRLAAMRAQREVSLREVARAIGLSASTVCRIEEGRDCSASSLVKVMKWIETWRPEADQ